MGREGEDSNLPVVILMKMILHGARARSRFGEA
jgi:hypothetical protein